MLALRRPEIPSSVKEDVLREIAIYLLEGKEVFEEEELRRIIKTFLKKEGEDYKPDVVLKEIVEKSGLLCRLSDSRYIFLHLTFEEYLCANYITEKVEDPSQLLEPVLFNPRLREVVRLTAGMLKKPGEARHFIEFILKQEPLYHHLLHQPLLLAGLCIADVMDDRSDPMFKGIEERIQDQLWGLWKRNEFEPLQEEINRVFTTIARAGRGDAIINRMLKALEDKNESVRGEAARALGESGRLDDKVIDALLRASEDKESIFTRGSAAWALGELGRADDKVIDALLGALKDKNREVKDAAYFSLQQLVEKRAREAKVSLPEDEKSKKSKREIEDQAAWEAQRPLPKSLPYEAGKEDIQLNYIVKTYISTGKKINICDYGCGNGLFLAALSNFPEKSIGIYLPIDEDNDALTETGNHMLDNPQIAQPPDSCKPGNLDLRKYKEEFDLVIMHHLLHEISRPHEVFEQIFKLLKPGGKIIIGDLSFFHWYEPDHVFWDCEKIKELFDAVRFDVNCFPHIDQRGRKILSCFCLLKSWRIIP